jgi:uroporphyrinogen-III decarboxylase
VKEPLIADIADWRLVKPPYEVLPADKSAARDEVNRNCAKTDKFVRAGCCPRPWEQYQFLRGSENAFIDVMEPDAGTRQMLKVMQDFYLTELEFWVKTDVDAISFMDDWGSQRQLLIPPRVWRDLFKPLYKQYCDLAHAHGKFVFMHSDGFIQDVYPDLVEIGVDALNSQVFCMDMAKLARIAKGKLTFWGEIDRQHVLTATPDVGRKAVRSFCEHFYDPAGGVIAQFEFTPGSNPETALVLFDEWDKVHRELAPACIG